MKSKALQHLHTINIQDEYGTDPDILKNACKKFQIFPKIDVCTNLANKKFSRFFTKSDDALSKKWDDDFYMNPPYSIISDFMEYAYLQHISNNVSGLILTYSKTDTKWWHRFVEGKAEVHFIEGRLRFLNENGKIPRWCKKCKINTEVLICENCGNRTSINSAPYPSCWIIYRKNEIRI